MGFWDFLSGSTPAGIISDTGAKVAGTVFDGISSIIRDFKLPPEQQVAFDSKIAELKAQYAMAILQDRNSARQMQIATHSVWPGILSTLVLLGFSAMTAYIIKFGLPALDTQGSEALLMLIGTLNMGVGMVLQFWLGSSSGSQAKDQMIYRSQPISGNGK